MKILEWLLGLNSKDPYHKSPFRRFIKTEAAILYISILQLMHRLILYFVKIIVSLLIIYLGILFLLVVVAIHSEYIVAVSSIVGILFVIIPIIAIVILLSPSTWMKVFSVDKFLEDIKEVNKPKNF